MSFLSFVFYVVIVYVLYYVVIILYDFLVSKLKKKHTNSEIVQYEIADEPTPKVAKIYEASDEELESGQSLAIDTQEDFSSEEPTIEKEISPSVDIDLERVENNRKAVRKTMQKTTL